MGHTAVVLTSLLLAAMAGSGEAATPDQQVQQGQTLFQERCIACHTIGQGDRVGPDLAGVFSRRDHAWLVRWIAAPDRMLAEGDPTAKAMLDKYQGVPMPNMGLTPNQVAVVLVYLESGTPPAGPQVVAAPAPGDPAVGVVLQRLARRVRRERQTRVADPGEVRVLDGRARIAPQPEELEREARVAVHVRGGGARDAPDGAPEREQDDAPAA